VKNVSKILTKSQILLSKKTFHLSLMNLEGKDLVSIRDLTKEEIFFILRKADEMLPFASGEKKTRALEGKILATLFFEPSTRTKMRFEAAMHRLGGDVIGFSEPAMTSIKKGETLADTV